MHPHFSFLRQQIGVDASKHGFEEITKVLCYFADHVPFENLDVLHKNSETITPEFLLKKLIDDKRGGLCYEINSLIYLLLKDLGYDAVLVQGTVLTENGWATEGTHVIVIVNLHGKQYVVDNGFGSNIARQPVEINGNPVTAPAGCFRVVERTSEKGTVAYEKWENDEWTLKYAFHLKPIAWEELDRIKRVITESEQSAFNKQLLISQCLSDKTYSINESRMRVRSKDGEADTAFEGIQDLLRTIQMRTNESIYKQANNYFHISE